MKLLVLSLLLIVFFQKSALAQNLVTNNQLLWQISGNGLKKSSYLFGTYHSNDPRVFKLCDSVYSAFNQAEALVLEADIYKLFNQYDARTNEVQLKFDANGKAYTSMNRASLTKYGDENGRPQFLDLYFQQIGYNMGKSFFPLETIEQQLEVLDFVYSRSNAQRSLEQLKILQNNLLLAYLRGDIEHVKSIIQHQMSNSTESYDRLIVKRNAIMAKGIDTLCRNKSLFIAVGAGHLAGENGIISLLRQKGYFVRLIAATYSEQKSPSEKKFLESNSFTYENPLFKLKAKFAGKPVIDTSTSVFRIIYQELGQGNTYLIEIENLIKQDLSEYINAVIDPPKESIITEVKHQNKFKAYEGVGYDEFDGLSWKRVFVVNDKLVKLICNGGNKFMNSNRPQSFFNNIVFEE